MRLHAGTAMSSGISDTFPALLYCITYTPLNHLALISCHVIAHLQDCETLQSLLCLSSPLQVAGRLQPTCPSLESWAPLCNLNATVATAKRKQCISLLPSIQVHSIFPEIPPTKTEPLGALQTRAATLLLNTRKQTSGYANLCECQTLASCQHTHAWCRSSRHMCRHVYQPMWRQLSPAYTAFSPSSSSIRNSWLYLANRSDLQPHRPPFSITTSRQKEVTRLTA